MLTYFLFTLIVNIMVSLEHDSGFELCSLHINIHSVPAKLDTLKIILERFKESKLQIHFILLCETFLKDENVNQYQLHGYNMLYRNILTCSRGEIAIYIMDTFNYTEIENVELNWDAEFESVFAKINLENRNFIGEIYRVPNTNEKTSMDRYKQVIEYLTHQYPQYDLIIGTDQNVAYMKTSSHINTSILLDTLYTEGIIPVIDKPTRITHSTATGIDNIYVKLKPSEMNLTTSGIIQTDISDSHLPIFFFIRNRIKPKVKKVLLKFRCRPINDNSIENMVNELKNYDWNGLTSLSVNDT